LRLIKKEKLSHFSFANYEGMLFMSITKMIWATFSNFAEQAFGRLAFHEIALNLTTPE
jgi:hypothetical protein